MGRAKTDISARELHPCSACSQPLPVSSCSLFPLSPFTYLSSCFHTMPDTATKIKLSMPQPSPPSNKKSRQQSFGPRFPLGDLGSCCPWGFYTSPRQSIIVQACTTGSIWPS
ncbi:hypothetical protein IMY05_011G0032600 [Salix suchowensis]|nr:hypothetical protein IMY05_011G0032600 [Salix suchowensis]